jgi:GTPase SAR1 family protein
MTSEIESLIEAVDVLPDVSLHSADKWRKACDTIKTQIAEDLIRVAIVGPIKSGKSTFANALLGGDYLKRGAGVVTSIVTRIAHGDALSAELQLKTWQEINEDIERALVLFPNQDWRQEEKPFDLRRTSDRDGLAEAVRSLSPDQLITNDARNANSVLLFSYLKGYEAVADLIGENATVVRYGADRFLEHRRFVGEDALAVYLRDVQLSVPLNAFGSAVELADCQGSDSPNPLHLAMIQDYLLTTHLIIYVISSRTGLRRADLDFISIIKKMGIADHVLFVLNIDFGEHESRADLEVLIGKVTEELSLLVPEPTLYSFSALYRLFRFREGSLSEKDRLRIDQWETDPDLLERSRNGESAFIDAFKNNLYEGALTLLLSNPSERLCRIASGIGQLIAVKRRMLTTDTTRAGEILERVHHHLDQMTQVSDIIRSTLKGGQSQIQRELRSGIDRFFDDRDGEATAAVIGFVNAYSISAIEDYAVGLKRDGFPATMYRVYQEFRQALERLMAESINPEIIRFISSKEERIADHLHTLVAPYRALVRDAVAGVNLTLAEIGVDSELPEDVLSEARLDMQSVRREAKLSIPSVRAVMRYSAKVKTEAVFRLGVYRVFRGIKKLLKKPLNAAMSEERLALEDGLGRLKKETEAALRFHFKDIRENIKFGYLFKLLEAGSGRLGEILLDRIDTYTSDLAQMVEGVHVDQSQMADRAERLKNVCDEAERLLNRLRATREDIGRIH